MIRKVQSADGTSIAFETTGSGPALILVGGGLCDRHASASGTPLAALLAKHFTVYSYDRRGRGDSDDTPAKGNREIEDIAAIINAAGESAFVFGNSSGGLLALDAAAQGLAISKVVVFEPPVIMDKARAESIAGLANELAEAAASGQRGSAVEQFLTKVVQVPAPAVAGMRRQPMWTGLEALAHTLSYDLRITARGPARLDEMRTVRAPTLVLDGSASPAWMREPLQALARAIPNARHETLEGQTHAVDPKALAQAIDAYLRA